ncbi:hypothetical protein BH09BAC3_BH09BAC3_33450 [soil metagenome]
MNFKLRLILISVVLTALIISCNWTNKTATNDSSEIEKWKLGWRLINSSLDKNYQLGEQQFDSILKMNGFIETRFIITGLEILSELGKKEKIIGILSKQEQSSLEDICNRELFTKKLRGIQICTSFVKDEDVKNTPLQLELIKMYLNDQSVRGNILREIITKYNLNDYELTKMDGVSLDRMNRDRLNQIIIEFGFPTRQLVGRDAMHGVFLMIQHSDGNKEWQKEQLPNIERAVKQGDLDGQSYAYLYDRIKINGGEKQLYGTQFKNVDPINRKVELADVEDLDNLDKRRMEFGMMPVQMYKQFMLRNLQK